MKHEEIKKAEELEAEALEDNDLEGVAGGLQMELLYTQNPDAIKSNRIIKEFGVLIPRNKQPE